MNTPIKLSDTQREVIKLATYRPDGNIEPLPPDLRGGARKKVIDGLLVRDLITEVHVADHAAYCLTDAAYTAVGKKRKAPEPVIPEVETEPAVVPDRPRTRSNSKQASVIEMLQRPEGATIQQIMDSTGWMAHTVRGTFAGAFKKKLGLNLTSDKTDGGERTYRIA
jgi:hypothetical protein